MIYIQKYTSDVFFLFFFFNDTATTEIYTLSLHDALPIPPTCSASPTAASCAPAPPPTYWPSTATPWPTSAPSPAPPPCSRTAAGWSEPRLAVGEATAGRGRRAAREAIVRCDRIAAAPPRSSQDHRRAAPPAAP